MARQRREIWTADCETDPFKKGRIPAPFIWGLYNGEEYWEFTETDEFVNFLYDKNVVVYAHNGGKFDWHFLTQYIVQFEPLTIINGRLAKFKIGECEFRDSFNIIPAPLSAYKKDEFDYGLLEIAERHKPENWAKIKEYLKNDCVYLHEMVSQFIDLYGMHLTQAGSAMNTWSKMSGIKKPQSTAFYYHDMAPYYYGGRVQCFETGEINDQFTVIDINSAYPHAMTFEHPWGMNYSTYDELPDWLTVDQIQRAFIKLKADSLGAFPYRQENGLAFPNDGEPREFTVTGWEYLAAIETGALRNAEIIQVRLYLEHINFKEYVDYFYDIKREAEARGDAAGRLFAKIFLNSLYGKFASNPENYEEYMTIPAGMLQGADADGWKYCKLISDDTAVVCKPLDEERHRYYDIAVSASITGFVRAHLWRTICLCDRVIYCDTDSIAARAVNSAPISKQLGDWSIDAECDYGAVAGKKLYAFRKADGKGWKLASKGVRLEAAEIVAIARGESVTHTPDVPTFSIKRGIEFTPRKITRTEK
jgi:hypothetical protein